MTFFRTGRATRRSLALIVVTLAVSLLGAITVGATSTADRYHGSLGVFASTHPIVGIVTTPTGHGYWLVASDGGVFTFGDAKFYGSTGGRALDAPIVGIAATPSGHGYWLAGVDGGVFTFGDAKFYGSARGAASSVPILGIASTRSGDGYWLAAVDGGTDAFGHARTFRTQFPSAAASILPPGGNAVDSIAASPNGGYIVASSLGAVGVSTKPPTSLRQAPPSVRPVPLSQRTPAKTTPRLSPLIALQILIRMNAERGARHLPPLSWNQLLASRAKSWAQTLLAAGAFHHQNLEVIIKAADGSFEEVGENIFSGSGSAANAGAAHVGFMHSPDHRANMLLPQGQLVGIGAACLNGTLMVVEDFAIRTGAPLPPAGQPVPPMNPIVAPETNGASC